MNKGSLIDAVFAKIKSESLHVSKNDLSKIVDMLFDSIVDGVQKDKIVRIVGFGTWMCVERKARKGRNPSTGHEITIPARTDIKFSIGKQTKDIINNY
ncbi:DNA-binding protein HU-1 [Candidatus Xenohaliotis californiensis]|uniref:DNA-binding protein HU-1 n=1 Tax=Candidatus Xenohaliotis californiensis TaxID=84677 RepID=A0ABP0EUU7_9RICK|nr:DNA-binding protein HU-1 [Candidatus Xenohaliotis californiensis]